MYAPNANATLRIPLPAGAARAVVLTAIVRRVQTVDLTRVDAAGKLRVLLSMLSFSRLIRDLTGLEEVGRDGALLGRGFGRACAPGGLASWVLAVADVRVLVLRYN